VRRIVVEYTLPGRFLMRGLFLDVSRRLAIWRRFDALALLKRIGWWVVGGWDGCGFG
jgi:hypothetical protein